MLAVLACQGLAEEVVIEAEGGVPVEMTARTATYSPAHEVVVAEGDVVITRAGHTITCDRAEYHLTRGEIHGTGNVVGTAPTGTFETPEVFFNINTGQTRIGHGRAHSGIYHLDGGPIERGPDGEVLARRGSLTTCELEHPHYRLAASRIRIRPGVRLWAHHVRMKVKMGPGAAPEVPIAYIPFYTRSLSGGELVRGLVFSPGHSSRKGGFVLARYNFDPADEVSASVFGDYFTKIGAGGGLGVEYRAADDDAAAKLHTYYIDEEDGVFGEEEAERHKIHLRTRNEFEHDLLLIIRADRFSDDAFNDDYKHEELWRGFSRTELENQRPEGSASIVQHKEDYAAAVYTRSRINDWLDVVEELPRLSFDLKERPLGQYGLYGDVDVRFSRLVNAPEGVEASEADAVVRLSRPLRVGWLRAEPALRGRRFLYSRDDREHENRTMGALQPELGLSANFHRDVPFRDGSFRHTFAPRAKLSYMRNPTDRRYRLMDFQTALPDRTDEVYVEVINALTRSYGGGGGRNLVFWDVFSTYDRTEEDRRWDNISSDLSLWPTPAVALRSETEYNIYVDHFERLDNTVSYQISDTSMYGGTRVYEPEGEDDVFDLIGGLTTPMGRMWKLQLSARYDTYDDRFNFRRVGLWRDLHCWDAQVVWEQERGRDGKTGTTVYVALMLKGVPGVRIGGDLR